MAWWDKVVSAAKSAVNIAVSAVKAVVSTVAKTVSGAVSTAKAAVSAVTSAVVKKVADTVKKVEPAVNVVKEAVKITAEKVIDTAGEKVKDAVNYIKKDAEEKVVEASEKREEAEVTAEGEKEWYSGKEEVILTTFGIQTLEPVKKGLDRIPAAWDKLTRGILSKTKFAEFVRSIPATQYLSLMVYGEDLEGVKRKPTTGEAASFWLILAAIGATAGILATAGFMIAGAWGATAAGMSPEIFKTLTLDEQAKVLKGLAETDAGRATINELLKAKALSPSLVRPIISIMDEAIKNKILYGSGLGAIAAKVLAPKTIMWGLSGMLGLVGMAYGIPFGTEWFAKEGLSEMFTIPISDRMRTWRITKDPETKELIEGSIRKLEATIPKTEALIKSVAWLWPFTKDEWYAYIDGLKFELEQVKTELAEAEKITQMPEEVKTYIRDIIDGDTIDASLDAINKKTGSAVKLPEYQKTTHARVRIVGINAPEKSPKGEIVCSDVEIYKVEATYADQSRSALLPLNDKQVILKTDNNNLMDSYGRILAVVEHEGKDIGLRQITEGMACGYYREPHKYVDQDKYAKATLKAKEKGIGMWKGLEEVEKEEDKIKIIIKSSPTNAKLFLDDIALHHNTPSDEKELSDVMHLFTLGKHVLSAEKGGLSAMKDIVIVKGDNGTIELILETAPVPGEIEAPVEEAEPPVEAPPVEAPPVLVKYTESQKWALKEAMEMIWAEQKKDGDISEVERETLIAKFGLYSKEQTEALLPLWVDLEVLTRGLAKMSKAEFKELLIKYQVVMEV